MFLCCSVQQNDGRVGLPKPFKWSWWSLLALWWMEGQFTWFYLILFEFVWFSRFIICTLLFCQSSFMFYFYCCRCFFLLFAVIAYSTGFVWFPCCVKPFVTWVWCFLINYVFYFLIPKLFTLFIFMTTTKIFSGQVEPARNGIIWHVYNIVCWDSCFFMRDCFITVNRNWRDSNI